MSKSQVLENFMKENNLSKAQLAKMCGVSVYLISRVLERRNVSSDTLFNVSVATRITVDDLLGIN